MNFKVHSIVFILTLSILVSETLTLGSVSMLTSLPISTMKDWNDPEGLNNFVPELADCALKDADGFKLGTKFSGFNPEPELTPKHVAHGLSVSTYKELNQIAVQYFLHFLGYSFFDTYAYNPEWSKGGSTGARFNNNVKHAVAELKCAVKTCRDKIPEMKDIPGITKVEQLTSCIYHYYSDGELILRSMNTSPDGVLTVTSGKCEGITVK
jgi:hypothetical protein